ncbi:myristoylated alanine-rich C-kinase substrate-like [Arapaima gigas]
MPVVMQLFSTFLEITGTHYTSSVSSALFLLPAEVLHWAAVSACAVIAGNHTSHGRSLCAGPVLVKDLCGLCSSTGSLEFLCWLGSMGAQTSKTTTKAEVDAEKQEDAAVSPGKSNGQENGHTKVNGDASAAAQDEAQVNGNSPAEEGPKEEADKAEAEPAEKEAEDKTDATPPPEGAAASEDGASSSGEAKKKKRFSFKKPFKLSGFSFKKNKKEAEGEAAVAAPSEEGATTPPEPGKDSSAEEAPAVGEAAGASDGVEEKQEVTASREDKQETTEGEQATATPTADESQQNTEEADQEAEAKPAEDSTQDKPSDSEAPTSAE